MKSFPRTRPICLPLDRSQLYEDEYGAVAGWGVDSGLKKTSDVLQWVKVLVMSNNDCQNKWTWIKRYVKLRSQIANKAVIDSFNSYILHCD